MNITGTQLQCIMICIGIHSKVYVHSKAAQPAYWLAKHCAIEFSSSFIILPFASVQPLKVVNYNILCILNPITIGDSY